MLCLKPLYIVLKPKTNQVYGQIGRLKDFEEKRAIAVRCSKCENCKFKKFNNWKARLELEAKGKNVYFLTLTVDNEHMNNIDVSSWTNEIKKFFKRLRYNNKLTSKNLKYFWVVELGTKSLRLHYHCLLFLEKNINVFDFDFEKKGKKIHNHLYYLNERISKSWKLGYHSITKLENTDAGIAYVLKYLLKKPLAYGYSKNLGLEEIKKSATTDYYLHKGYLFSLPDNLKEKSDLIDFSKNEKMLEVNFEKYNKDIKKVKDTKILNIEIEGI